MSEAAPIAAPPAGPATFDYAPESRPLYAINADVRALFDFLTSVEGVLPEGEAGEEIERYLEDLTTEHNGKLDSYARLIGWFRSKATREAAERATAQAEVDRYAAREADATTNADRLEKKLRDHFLSLGVNRHDTGKHTFVLSRAGGKLGVDRLVPIDRMPPELRTEVVTITYPGTGSEKAQERIAAAVVALREAGIAVEVKVAQEFADQAARTALDMAIIERGARQERIARLVDELEFAEESAQAAEPPTEAEAVLDFVAYRPRKVTLKIE